MRHGRVARCARVDERLRTLVWTQLLAPPATAFGGAGADAEPLGDTWAFDGTTWTAIEGAGPPPSAQHAIVEDAARGSCVLSGGRGKGDIMGRKRLRQGPTRPGQHEADLGS